MGFEHLFRVGKIGTLELRNRIVMLPMSTGYASQDGQVTEQMIAYYQERAKGGVGLIIVEASCVESRVGRVCIGHNGRGGLRIDDDKFIPGLTQLARAIQQCGASAAIQLVHTGRDAKSSVTGVQPVAPSPIPRPAGDGVAAGEMPRELTTSEIGDIVTCFAKAAERAKKAGFDGVEIHGAHGYLIHQFLSAESNRRQDAYGGDLKKRKRFLLEIVHATKQSVGQTYPIWCRMNPDKATETGRTNTLEEFQEQAQTVDQSGVAAFNISGFPPTQSYFSPPGYFVHAAEAAKKVVQMPVIAGGGITAKLGETILEEGKTDFIGMGRTLIVDPRLPKKLASGKLEDVAPCIRCLQCVHSIHFGLGSGPLQCTVNAAVGRERECTMKPAQESKRVLIVGGGPAGMEAARVAALRGHKVTLYDKNSELGGQMLLASKPPHKDLITDLTNYLVGQIRKLGVKIELGKKVESALLASINPDVLVLATGVLPLTPKIKGVDRENVVTFDDVLSGKARVGQRIALIGGGLVGLETALWLAVQDKQVIVIEELAEMAATLIPRLRYPLMKNLTAKGVRMFVSVKCQEITERGLLVTDSHGRQQMIEVDTVVLAAGATPERKLLKALQSRVPEIYLAGDCVKPSNLFHAIHDAFHIAYRL